MTSKTYQLLKQFIINVYHPKVADKDDVMTALVIAEDDKKAIDVAREALNKADLVNPSLWEFRVIAIQSLEDFNSRFAENNIVFMQSQSNKENKKKLKIVK